MSISKVLAIASAWIATAIAVIFGMKYTGSANCLWAFMFPVGAVAELSDSDNNDNENEENND